MTDKIQKRLVTFEIISKGDQPVDLNDVVQESLLAHVHKAIASSLDLRYQDIYGNNRRHDFVGVSIKEIN